MNVSQAVNALISQSPFLEESLTDGIINISSLARRIQPDVEQTIGKKVTLGAIVMAINRHSPGYYLGIARGLKGFMSKLGDIIVRSDLCDYTFENSPTLSSCQNSLMDEIVGEKDIVLTLSQGVYETTIVASINLDSAIRRFFSGEKMIAYITNLCSLTIRLPADNTEVSGVYYYILKNIAWIGMNVREVISTSNEFTLVVSAKDVHRSFEVLMNLKRFGGR